MSSLNNGDQIVDDTDLSLLDRTNFQTLDNAPIEQVDAFVGQVDELGEDKVHFARNPYVRLGVGAAFLAFVLGFGGIFMLGKKGPQVAEGGRDRRDTGADNGVRP